jgi:hypothetical protein
MLQGAASHKRKEASIMNNADQTKKPSLTFESWYDEITRDWQRKAEALQARRWQIVNRKS